MRVDYGRFGSSTKNATDGHNAEAVVFDIHSDVPLIFQPPENTTLF